MGQGEECGWGKGGGEREGTSSGAALLEANAVDQCERAVQRRRGRPYRGGPPRSVPAPLCARRRLAPTARRQFPGLHQLADLYSLS